VSSKLVAEAIAALGAAGIAVSNSKDAPIPADSRLVITPWVAVPGIVTGAFEAGDAFGSMGTFTVDIEGNPLPKKGFIVGARLLDKDDDTLSATMHVFWDTFTPTASKDALALLAADSEKAVTVMGFDDGSDEGAYKIHEITVWNSFYYSPSQKLYFQFSTAGVPNIAAAGMVLVQIAILPMI